MPLSNARKTALAGLCLGQVTWWQKEPVLQANRSVYSLVPRGRNCSATSRLLMFYRPQLGAWAVGNRLPHIFVVKSTAFSPPDMKPGTSWEVFGRSVHMPAITCLSTHRPTSVPTTIPTSVAPTSSPSALPSTAPTALPSSVPTFNYGQYFVCARGSYANAKGCTYCPPGKYQGSPGKAYCIDCPTGRYQIADRTRCVVPKLTPLDNGFNLNSFPVAHVSKTVESAGHGHHEAYVKRTSWKAAPFRQEHWSWRQSLNGKHSFLQIATGCFVMNLLRLPFA